MYEPIASFMEKVRCPGWDLVLPCCLTNGAWGYVGMEQNYIEASYETRGSQLKAGCGERMIENGLRLLEQIR